MNNNNMQSPQQQKQQNHENCSCKLCQKQQQIEKLKKQKTNLHLHSIYKNDFVKKKRKQKQQNYIHLENEKQIRSARVASVQYIDLQSSYGIDFVKKATDIQKVRPIDQLGGNTKFMPSCTTYMRSFKSTVTPKPDQPFKKIQMPVANTIQFSSQSTYQKSYHPKNPKPNLPYIHHEAVSLPKSIGIFETTQRKSYSTINPQISSNKYQTRLKRQGNITNLHSFIHGYDTTYRNYFVTKQKKTQQKHGIDQLGNINKRSPKSYFF